MQSRHSQPSSSSSGRLIGNAHQPPVCEHGEYDCGET